MQVTFFFFKHLLLSLLSFAKYCLEGSVKVASLCGKQSLMALRGKCAWVSPGMTTTSMTHTQGKHLCMNVGVFVFSWLLRWNICHEFVTMAWVCVYVFAYAPKISVCEFSCMTIGVKPTLLCIPIFEAACQFENLWECNPLCVCDQEACRHRRGYTRWPLQLWSTWRKG